MPLPIPQLLALALQGASAFGGRRRRRFDQRFYNRISPEQIPVIQNLLGLTGQGGLLSRQAAQDPTAFGGLDDSIIGNLRQNILPSITGQYGALGLGSSSSLNNALAQSLGRATTQLASQRFDRSQQALQSLLGANQQILGNPFQQSFLQAPGQSLLGALGSLGQTATSLYGLGGI